MHVHLKTLNETTYVLKINRIFRYYCAKFVFFHLVSVLTRVEGECCNYSIEKKSFLTYIERNFNTHGVKNAVLCRTSGNLDGIRPGLCIYGNINNEKKY